MVTNLRDKVQFFPDVVAGLVLVLPGTGNGNVGSALSPLSTSAVSAAIMTQHGAENRDRIEKIQLEFLISLSLCMHTLRITLLLSGSQR